MQVHRSNNARALVDALAQVVETAPRGSSHLDPLQPEVIVVQSAGMGRWLTMELAQRRSVWAHPDLPFPRGFIERALGGVGQDDDRPPFSAEALRWSVTGCIEPMLGEREFEPLARYLERDDGGRSLVALASRIADTFDRYAVHRPEMVLRWEQGQVGDLAPEHRWQPKLWNAVVDAHRPHVARRAHALMQTTAPPVACLPGRVSLFGVSTLPPLYVQILAHLRTHLDVHLFLLSPSPGFFGDAPRRKQQARAGQATESSVGEQAHPFLESMGRVAAEFQEVIEERTEGYVDGHSQFVSPRTGSLLGQLQSAIFEGRRDAAVDSAALGDGSIRVHATHSPMREVQVLHNELLELFARDPSLRPRDVIVMTPDIERHAPYVDAVFGSRHGGGAIPYRVADRSERASYGVVEAFFRVVDVATGRLSAPQVVDLLNLDSVRERFSIGPEEVDAVRAAVDAAGIRWARDAEHRVQWGQPAYRENTFRFGLDRLLLGHAMDDSDLWRGIAPLSRGEAPAELLGRFSEFCEALFAVSEMLTGERTVAQWCERLARVLGDTLRVSDVHEYQAARLRGTLDEFRRFAQGAGFERAVSVRAVLDQLERALSSSSTSGTFLSGGVTFCELVPMRSIPFRRVCLLGLDDDVFPRRERAPGFSLVALHRHKGDRSPRDDDRYLFLEALLAARDGLSISYVGQGIQDNRVRPPSVVVDELLDEIERLSGVRDVRTRLVTVHPIQSFSPRYFSGDDSLFSYARDDHAGARAIVAGEEDSGTQLVAAAPAEPVDTVGVGELTSFFRFPARYYLQRKIGLQLDEQYRPLADREPITQDGISGWEIGETYLRQRHAGASAEDAVALLRAQGRLPPGALAALDLRKIRARAEAILRCVAEYQPAELSFRDLDFDCHGVRVRGRVHDTHAGGRMSFMYGQLDARRQLGAWISHLVLAAGAPEEPVRTILVGRDGDDPVVLAFDPVPDAPGRLLELVRLFELGQRAPLPFAPVEALAIVERARRDQVDPRELRLPKPGRYSDVTSPWAVHAFDGDDFRHRAVEGRDGELSFFDLATTVFEPLLRARRIL